MALQFTSIAELCEMVKILTKTTSYFRSQLRELDRTLQSMQYIYQHQTRHWEVISSNREAIALILEAEKLVRKCPKIKWNLFKKFSHGRKLKDVNYKLLQICQTEIDICAPLTSAPLTKEPEPLTKEPELLTKEPEPDPESAKITDSAPTSANPRESLTERLNLGWRVTRLPKRILTFEEPLTKLKARVLVSDSSVVVVSAASGCGKTNLVKILCNDPEIEAKYGENIFYVTVPEKPDFMEMVDDLLDPSLLRERPIVQSNKDAKDKLKYYLSNLVVFGPILLVLDDVQSDLFIKNFEFKIKGYKILVTSKMIFRKYDVFHLEPLSDEDAKALFKLSAFGDNRRNYSSTIDDDLVNQMVKYCKKHPLTLYQVADSLNGKSNFVWKSVMKTLSQDEWVKDNKELLKRLQRMIVKADEEFEKCLSDFEALDEKLKKCLLDFGLFPEGHRIPACALLDMWTNLYDHDDKGRDTLNKIFQLADANLVSSITIGEEANAVVNYCEQTFATQQEWQRELAIHFSSKEPIPLRTRLIIDAQANHDLPASIRQVEKFWNARILSITTGESFSSRWCNMNVPDVEVMVLNIMSQTYTLPHFLENMLRLKVLNVTNYGLHPTKFVNFHLFGKLSSLTRIRLERVVLSLLSTSMLALVNLQKLSFIMCKAGIGFEKLSTDNPKVWPRLVEIEIDSCQDLVAFPELYCNNVHLEKLSITNCNEMIKIPEQFGKLTSLETLSLRSCTRLEKLPNSISRLEKLSILDISDCLSLREFPEHMGELGGLRIIYMKGCTGIHELPPSVKELSQLQVFCNEDMSYKWHEFPNVQIPVVEEDRLFTLSENFS